eukprot:scaffold182834_cov15-Tisochrysis_lutea.AAC.1
MCVISLEICCLRRWALTAGGGLYWRETVSYVLQARQMFCADVLLEPQLFHAGAYHSRWDTACGGRQASVA